MQNQLFTQSSINPIQQLFEKMQLVDMIPALIAQIDSLEKLLRDKTKSEGEKEYYTIPEAASILSVSTRTVRRLVEKGILKRTFSIRHIRITAGSLKGYSRLTTL